MQQGAATSFKNIRTNSDFFGQDSSGLIACFHHPIMGIHHQHRWEDMGGSSLITHMFFGLGGLVQSPSCTKDSDSIAETGLLESSHVQALFPSVTSGSVARYGLIF